MNQLTKLIEQCCGEKGLPSFMVKGLIKEVENEKGNWLNTLLEWLASRPTCGVEQRKFLDEIEKTYKFKDMGMGVLIKKKNWRHDVTEIMQKDFAADLSKVIKGE